jgi:hypothetical protein
MFHRMKRHPFPVVAHFRHALVLTYAFPERLLAPLLPPGLSIDAHHGLGFLAIAMVQTERLRPAGLPAFLGQDFFLTGYRIFARFQSPSGRAYRGLRILRSDTDRRLMVFSGNLLTHYAYRKCRAEIHESPQAIAIRVATPREEADLDLTADLGSRPAPLPAGSPFADLGEARRFAGPLPYTFDYEEETHSIVRIEGVRENWDPQPIAVDVRRATFLDREPFRSGPPVLANAFHVADIPYRWERGVVEPLTAREKEAAVAASRETA